MSQARKAQLPPPSKWLTDDEKLIAESERQGLSGFLLHLAERRSRALGADDWRPKHHHD